MRCGRCILVDACRALRCAIALQTIRIVSCVTHVPSRMLRGAQSVELIKLRGSRKISEFCAMRCAQCVLRVELRFVFYAYNQFYVSFCSMQYSSCAMLNLSHS